MIRDQRNLDLNPDSEVPCLFFLFFPLLFLSFPFLPFIYLFFVLVLRFELRAFLYFVMFLFFVMKQDLSKLTSLGSNL